MQMVFGTVVGVVLGAALGTALGVVWAQRRAAVQVTGLHRRHAAELADVDDRAATLTARVAAAEAGQRHEQQLLDAFGSLSATALDDASRRFLDLANERFTRLEEANRRESADREKAVGSLVAPVHEQLHHLHEQLRAVERERKQDKGSLTELLGQLHTATTGLQSETRTLRSAMRDVRVRGSWGELQLKRVVELAGMVEHCDFSTQHTVTTPERTGRPDLVVWLPGGRSIIVDAKVPLNAFLDAAAADDLAAAERRRNDHATAMLTHARELAKRDYTSAVAGSVDLVVMFVPGESFLAAACDADPTLLERTLDQGVVLATPTTLVALLKAVAMGWREEQLAEHAAVIAELGTELYERTCVFAGHLDKVGRSLRGTVDSFNASIGSMESRLLPSARKLAAHGASNSRTLPALAPVELSPRAVTSIDPPAPLAG